MQPGPSAPPPSPRGEERAKRDASENEHACPQEELAHVEKRSPGVQAEARLQPQEDDDEGEVGEEKELVESRAREAPHHPRALSRWRLSFFVGREPPRSRGARRRSSRRASRTSGESGGVVSS